MIIVAPVHRKAAYFRAEVRWRHELPLPGRDQQPEFVKHRFDRMPRAVIPVEHPLCGVAPAKETNGGAWVRGPQLTGDFEKQASVCDHYAIRTPGFFKHSDAILESRAFEGLVRVCARNHAHDLIYEAPARFDQREMRTGQRIESSCEDSNTSGRSG